MRTYSGALTRVDNGTNIKVTGSAIDGNDAVVRSTINQSNGQSVGVDYRLEQTAGGWKIYDLNVEGIWLIQNYRNQFTNEINQERHPRPDQGPEPAQRAVRGHVARPGRRATLRGPGPCPGKPGQSSYNRGLALFRAVPRIMSAVRLENVSKVYAARQPAWKRWLGRPLRAGVPGLARTSASTSSRANSSACWGPTARARPP